MFWWHHPFQFNIKGPFINYGMGQQIFGGGSNTFEPHLWEMKHFGLFLLWVKKCSHLAELFAGHRYIFLKMCCYGALFTSSIYNFVSFLGTAHYLSMGEARGQYEKGWWKIFLSWGRVIKKIKMLWGQTKILYSCYYTCIFWWKFICVASKIVHLQRGGWWQFLVFFSILTLPHPMLINNDWSLSPSVGISIQ